MEKMKRIVFKLLFPHIALVVILAIVSAGLLIYAFGYPEANPVVAYVSYFVSAYALTIVCVRMPAILRKAKEIKQENKYIRRLSEEAGLRVKISLYISFAMNVAYAVLQLVLGFLNHSIWFYSLAGYYLLLVLIRYFLLKEVRQDRWGQNKFFELLIYRFCGILLEVMNVALAVVVFYIVWQNRGFEYHYIVTIAMAAYTFAALAIAIVNLIKYRRYDSPVMSASKAISLVSALVSMLSLETAMLTAFGDGSEALFRQIMTACTGGAVCVAVLVMAIYMIVHSTKEIKKLKGAVKDGE